MNTRITIPNLMNYLFYKPNNIAVVHNRKIIGDIIQYSNENINDVLITYIDGSYIIRRKNSNLSVIFLKEGGGQSWNTKRERPRKPRKPNRSSFY